MGQESKLSSKTVVTFQKKIYAHFHEHGRVLPWRSNHSPYSIIVSEIMLQQTQVNRVLQKYKDFLKQFPTFKSLDESSFEKVLSLWQGLGYNRRAISLHKIAKLVVTQYKNKLPDTYGQLLALPGIGAGTAGSIMAFAFNKPVVFIETNIRRVFIHFFFENKTNINDKEILPLIEETLDRENPRQWYYALMDYGAMLGRTEENANRKSTHYTKQSKFEGSRRQLRGMILKFLLDNKKATIKIIAKELKKEKAPIESALKELEREGFIKKAKNFYTLSN